MIGAVIGAFLLGAFVGITFLLFIQGVGTLSHHEEDREDNDSYEP